jgi:hypothetical protein
MPVALRLGRAIRLGLTVGIRVGDPQAGLDNDRCPSSTRYEPRAGRGPQKNAGLNNRLDYCLALRLGRRGRAAKQPVSERAKPGKIQTHGYKPYQAWLGYAALAAPVPAEAGRRRAAAARRRSAGRWSGREKELKEKSHFSSWNMQNKNHFVRIFQCSPGTKSTSASSRQGI